MSTRSSSFLSWAEMCLLGGTGLWHVWPGSAQRIPSLALAGSGGHHALQGEKQPPGLPGTCLASSRSRAPVLRCPHLPSRPQNRCVCDTCACLNSARHYSQGSLPRIPSSSRWVCQEGQQAALLWMGTAPVEQQTAAQTAPGGSPSMQLSPGGVPQLLQAAAFWGPTFSSNKDTESTVQTLLKNKAP